MEKTSYKVEYYTWFEENGEYIASSSTLFMYGLTRLENAIDVALDVVDMYIQGDDEPDKYKQFENSEFDYGAYYEDWSNVKADGIRVKIVPE